MQKLLLVLCFPCVFFSSTAFGQSAEDALMDAVSKLPKREKAYVHFDKGAYAPGETVWFTIYLMDGTAAATASKTVYIDWAGKGGKLLSHDVYPIIDGGAAGSFQVPETYAEGELNATVYTRWMLNFDSALLCRNRLLITPKNPNLASSGTLILQPQIAFFPEGGNMIAGIENRIAFKANDQYGRPLSVTGTIKNKEGKPVVDFASSHNGMGTFVFTPKGNEIYSAEWQTNGKKQLAKLPEPQREGVAFSVHQTADAFRFVVNKSAAIANAGFVLVGTMDNNMLFKAAIKKGSAATVQARIPTTEMPTGILTLTVFDSAMKAVAERLIFINNNDYALNAEVGFKRLGTSPRAKNTLLLLATDSITAHFSVSVTGVEVPYNNDEDIVSTLLLTAELKGEIYQPSYYFSDTTATVREHRDLLMLTHGWRRYNWQEIAQGKQPQLQYAKDTSYLVLSGRVMGLTSSQLRDLGSINLMYRPDSSKGLNILPVPVKSDGSFNSDDFVVWDTLNVYYSFPKEKRFALGATVKLMDGRIGAPSKVAVSALPFYSSDTAGAYINYIRSVADLQLQQLMRGATLENVTVTTKKRSAVEEMDKRYSSGLFSSSDAILMDPENGIAPTQDIFDWMMMSGKIPGLRVVNTSSESKLIWRNGQPALFLDEMPADVDIIKSIPLSNVAYVKAIRPPASMLMGGSSGAIVIYTKRGADRNSTPSATIQSNVAVGYSVTKEFYQPNYSSFKPENEKPDQRRTLLWVPSIISKPGQSAFEIDFYNNDVTKGFRVVVQGMSATGKLLSITKEIE